jgi:hypothetical protein
MNEFINQSGTVVSRKTLLLCVAAGCVTGLLGFLSFGWSSAIVPGILIFAAIVQPYSLRHGRWLLWVTAFLLTIAVGPICVQGLRTNIPLLKSLHDPNFIGMLFLLFASLLLICGCDLALLIDTLKVRQRRSLPNSISRGSHEWISWIGAFLLSLYLIPVSISGSVSYGSNGRLDVMLLSLALGLTVVVFDLAIVVDAIKIGRRRVAGPR